LVRTGGWVDRGEKRNAQIDVLDVGHAFIKGEWAIFSALTASFYLSGLKKASTGLFQLV